MFSIQGTELKFLLFSLKTILVKYIKPPQLQQNILVFVQTHIYIIAAKVNYTSNKKSKKQAEILFNVVAKMLW